MRRDAAFLNSIMSCRRAALVGLIALALAGCGRRGALEPDPASGLKASAKTTDEKAKDTNRNEVDGTRRVRGVVPPKQPFILDPIL